MKISVKPNVLWLSFSLSLSLLVLDCRHVLAREPSKPSEAYLDFARKACDVAESELPEITRVAEIVAQRYLNGGQVGFLANSQALQQELMGRSGGMIHIGFARSAKTDRPEAEKTNDVAIIGWERPPAAGELQSLKDARARGCYVIGFGPRKMPALAEYLSTCDAWFDTGFGDDDCVVRLDDGSMAGRGNCLMNVLHGWALTAEIVSVLTRHGKMPTMWKSFSYEDGREWADRYVGKKRFHDEFQVPPIPRGELAKEYLRKIRGYLRQFQQTQLAAIDQTAGLIAKEVSQGGKLTVATMGHTPWTFVGKAEDGRWVKALELNYGDARQMANYLTNAPDSTLVLRLGYSGQHRDETALFEKKHQRELLISASDNPRPEWQMPTNLVTKIEMGWEFGDACVSIESYPIKIFPPSGIMQLVAYECVNVEVLERLTATNGKN